MKKIFFFCVLAYFFASVMPLRADEKFNVRKTKWGMTQVSVENSELPLCPFNKTKETLI